MATRGGVIPKGVVAIASGGIIVPLLAVALLLGVAAAGAGVLPGDVAVTRAVQAVAVPGVGEVAEAANWAGGGTHLTLFAALAGIVLVVAGRSADAAFLAVVLAVRALNPALKAVTESPRPTPDLVRVSEQAPGWGFPSGHAMGVVLIYGGLAYVLSRRSGRRRVRALIVGLAAAAIAATGFGRIYSGAHWPSDVLGGFLWGTGLLLAVVQAQRVARAIAFFRRSTAPAVVESGGD